jgi:hypothetical protein
MEIKPTKIIKGQRLAKMLTEGNEIALSIGCVDMIASFWTNWSIVFGIQILFIN